MLPCPFVRGRPVLARREKGVCSTQTLAPLEGRWEQTAPGHNIPLLLPHNDDHLRWTCSLRCPPMSRCPTQPLCAHGRAPPTCGTASWSWRANATSVGWGHTLPTTSRWCCWHDWARFVGVAYQLLWSWSRGQSFRKRNLQCILWYQTLHPFNLVSGNAFLARGLECIKFVLIISSKEFLSVFSVSKSNTSAQVCRVLRDFDSAVQYATQHVGLATAFKATKETYRAQRTKVGTDGCFLVGRSRRKSCSRCVDMLATVYSGHGKTLLKEHTAQ